MVYVLYFVCWFFTTNPVLMVWGRCARPLGLRPGKIWTVKIRFSFFLTYKNWSVMGVEQFQEICLNFSSEFSLKVLKRHLKEFSHNRIATCFYVLFENYVCHCV